MEGFVGVPCVHALSSAPRAPIALRDPSTGALVGHSGDRRTPQRCPLPRVPGGTFAASDDRQTCAATAPLPMSETSRRPTPFDDLEPFAVLTAQGIAARLGVDPRFIRRAIARGELSASRTCGIRVLACDAAAWSREDGDRAGHAVPRACGHRGAVAGCGHRGAPPAPDDPVVRASAAAAQGRCRMSPGPALPSGIEVRRHARRDGSVTETFTVRCKEPDGSRRRRSGVPPTDAVDYQAQAPERQALAAGGAAPRAGRAPDAWRLIRAEVDGPRDSGQALHRAANRCLWEAHAEPGLGGMSLREFAARRVVTFRGEPAA